jgi:hypothetical protein
MAQVQNNADYQKGRYDELVERHKELLELFKSLEMHALINVPRSGVSGAVVNYQSGLKINPKVIGGTLGGTGITFSVLAQFLGLVPVTFGVSLAMFGFLYGILAHFMKIPEDEGANYPIPKAKK